MNSFARATVLAKFADLPLDAQNRLIRKIKAIVERPASSPLLPPPSAGPLRLTTLPISQSSVMVH